VRLDDGSRMSREVHVRFCESRGVRFPPATHLVVMCRSRAEAERALSTLTAILADLGLEPKAAKTRIVHLVEEGEGFEFLVATRGRMVRVGSLNGGSGV
jgi:RNA-directed DNA polymerase